MTNQEKKACLGRYREISSELDALIEEREEWLNRATRITPTMSGIPGGGSERGSMESSALKLAEIDQEIDALLRRSNDMRRQIRASINAVPDARLRQVLRLHYINGFTFEQIAERMHYSWRWVIKLHGRALSQVRVKRTW